MLRKVAAPLLAAVFLIIGSVSALAEGSYRYEDQLKGAEADLYSSIYTNLGKRSDSFTCNLSEPVDVSEASKNKLSDMAFRAFEAVYRDHPEQFWVSKSGLSITLQSNPSGQIGAVKMSASYHETSAIDAKQKELTAAVDAVLAKASGSNYEKLKTFHDALTENCAYDLAAKNSPSSNPDAFEAYGALVEGKAVCEGYSKAFKLLCDEAGIPCVIIGGFSEGEAHMWNYVELGGAYYLVDCTFDDPVGGQPGTAYFLKGSASTTDHKPGGGFLQNFDSGFTDPALSKTDYDPTKAPPASAASKPENSRCTVTVAKTEGGRCSVSFVGAGPLDAGQAVTSGVSLRAKATPQAGYTLKELRVKNGSETETGTGSYLYFTVAGNCEVSAVFEKTE